MVISLTLAFQFATPIIVGVLVTRYLRNVLRRLLIDLCGTEDRADFWVRVTAVMLVTTPLLLVMLASGNPLTCPGSDVICAVGVLRRTCVFTLTGVLVAVMAIARTAGRHIPKKPDVSSTAPVAEVIA